MMTACLETVNHHFVTYSRKESSPDIASIRTVSEFAAFANKKSSAIIPVMIAEKSTSLFSVLNQTLSSRTTFC